MSDMTITAECACGAKFSAIGYPAYVREEFADWTEIHKEHPTVRVKAERFTAAQMGGRQE